MRGKLTTVLIESHAESAASVHGKTQNFAVTVCRFDSDDIAVNAASRVSRLLPTGRRRQNRQGTAGSSCRFLARSGQERSVAVRSRREQPVEPPGCWRPLGGGAALRIGMGSVGATRSDAGE